MRFWKALTGGRARAEMKRAKQQIARQFSRAAKTYDASADLQRRMADRLIQQIPNDRLGILVDLGCGTGDSLEKISQTSTYELIGVDLAPGMISKARTRLDRARLFEGDLEACGLSTSSVDVVFSNAAIQWCNPRSAFEEISRILKPDGLALLSTFGPATLQQWKLAWKSIGDTQPRVHEFPTSQELAAAVAESGLQLLEISSERHIAEYDSINEMFQSIKRLGATNAATDRPRGLLGRDRFRRLCQYFERQLATSGSLELEFECVFIQAGKMRTSEKK